MAWYTEGQENASEEKTGDAGISSDVSNPSDEMPPSLYLEANKVPLVLEMIGGSSAYDHFDMKFLTNEVNGYILEEMRRTGAEDTPEEYQKLVDVALDKLGLPEGTDVYDTVDRLVRYFRIQHKLYTALRDKKDLMEADPLSLSASKLAQYLELKHGITRN